MTNEHDLGHHGDAEVGDGLIDLAVNVRRAPMPTFPGLGADWLRIAVRDTATADAFAAVLRAVLT